MTGSSQPSIISAVTDETETAPAPTPPAQRSVVSSPPPLPPVSDDVTVEIATDDNGYGTAEVSVVAFDVTDATCSDGSEVLWDWLSASSTSVTVRSKTKSSSVTVTLKTK
jgi:hypothetical protein